MTQRIDAEVLVVGAGPAGSALALQLARSGRDVLILERTRFPRDKPCGDCVNPGAVRELARLGLAGVLRQRLAPQSLRGWQIEAPDGRFFRGWFGDCEVGWAVRRRELDAALLDEALTAGARVKFGVRVFDVVTDGGCVVGVVAREGPAVRELRAAFVVGADGVRSVVQRRLELPARPPRLRKIALVGHLVRGNGGGGGGGGGGGEVGELRVRNGRVCGYAPFVSGGNVTLVIPESQARRIGSDARGFLLSALNDFPALRSRVMRAGLEEKVMVTGPFDRPVRRPWVPGALLVGDAAGYYDPFTGQGVYQALRSAALASAAIEAALGEPADASASLRRYGRALRAELFPTRALQRVVEAVVARPAVMSGFVRGLAGRPDVATAVIRATGDLDRPRRTLDPRLWLRLLLAMMAGRR